MKKIIVLSFLLISSTVFSQVEYLDLSGLSNSSSINSVPIGGTGETFNASITLIGSPPDPIVSDNGDIQFTMNSETSQQCINFTFSIGTELYITDHTAVTPIFNKRDSLSFSTNEFRVSDPLARFNVFPTSVVPIIGVSEYTDWNIILTNESNYQVCAQRLKIDGGASNNFFTP